MALPEPIRLLESKQVTLDGSGNGQVVFDGTYGTRWRITRISVDTGSNAAPNPIATVYRGSVQPTNIVDATYTGNQDTAEYPQPIEFVDGESLIVRWTGGNPADVATAVIMGQQV